MKHNFLQFDYFKDAILDRKTKDNYLHRSFTKFNQNKAQ